MKKQFRELENYLALKGFIYHPSRFEFRRSLGTLIDRIYVNVWTPEKRRFTASVYRHIPEIEMFWTNYGQSLNNFPDFGDHLTLNFNPNSIREKTWDTFYRSAPVYTFPVGNSDAEQQQLLEKVIADFEETVFPTLEQYTTIEQVASFLYDDIDALCADPLSFYRSKAWLLNYKMLNLKSCFIAKVTNHPDRKRIWNAELDFMRPFSGQGSETNDNMMKSLERLMQE